MPEMISKTEHEYGGRVVSKGERFEVEEQFVNILILLQRAELAPPKQELKQPKQEPVKQDEEEQTEPSADDEARAGEQSLPPTERSRGRASRRR